MGIQEHNATSHAILDCKFFILFVLKLREIEFIVYFYKQAVDELFKLMQLLVARPEDCTEQEEAEIASFRRGTLSSYLQGLDGRSCWATLISAFR